MAPPKRDVKNMGKLEPAIIASATIYPNLAWVVDNTDTKLLAYVISSCTSSSLFSTINFYTSLSIKIYDILSW